MASYKLCLMALFCSVIILSHFIGSTESASCCLMYTKRRIPCIRLLAYNIQTINTSCDINAIIFHIPGRFVCADPTAHWARMGRDCIDKRRREAEQVVRQETRNTTTSAQTRHHR